MWLGSHDPESPTARWSGTPHSLTAATLDLLTCGVFMYPVCSILNLPFTHAAHIRSLTHLKSLTNFEDRYLEDGARVQVPVSVVEQRVTQLGIQLLIGLSSFVSSVLGELPVAVLYGIFLYMGVQIEGH